MADETHSKNDKNIADTSSPKTDEEHAPDSVSKTPSEVLDIEAAELDQALESLTQVNEQDLKTPRIKELLHSPDTPSRFMTILSILFALLALITFALLISLYLKNKAANQPVVVAPEKSEVTQLIHESLGEFKLVVNPEAPREQQRELRVDVAAECSNAETCAHIKEHLVEARDLVIPILSTSTQEELLNADSKALIRRRIAERLNSMSMPGKVLQVNFTDLTIE